MFEVTWRNAINGRYETARYATRAEAEREAAEYRPYNNCDTTIRETTARTN